MKQVIKYFSPKDQQSFFEQLKTKAFIYLGMVGFTIVSFILIQNIIFPSGNYLVSMISSSVMGVFILITLFVLKNTNIKLAGNIFSVGLIILLAGALNVLNKDISALYKYVQGFYTLLAILSVGVLYASRRVLIINASIILASTIRVYFFAIEQSPDQAEILRAGFTNHTTALIIITFISYFTIKFVDSSIKEAKKDAKRSLMGRRIH